MFKFLKRLRGKKEEPQIEPELEAESSTPDPEPRVRLEPDKPTKDLSDDKATADPEVTEPAKAKAKKPSRQKPAPTTEVEPVQQVIDDPQPEPDLKPAPEPEAEVVEVELPKRSLSDGIRSLFSSNVDIDDLEDILLLADFGVEASVEITESLRKSAGKSGAELRLLLKDLLIEKLHRDDMQLNLSDGKLPYVFLVVGVNGAGKTTTIGKLAKWLRDGEWEVVLGAADTFRAAAVDQLETWANRAGAKIVRPERDGQDPASVAYQTVELAIKNDADIAIVDGTAKGGIVFTIQQQLDLPVKLVGVGEGVNDFAFFSAEEFANGLVARKPVD